MAADNFVNRTGLNGLAPSTSGSNIGATAEVGEPSQSGVINSVWWSWTAPHDGTFTIDTKNSNFDTQLSVFNYSETNELTLIKFDDDTGGNWTSLLSLDVIAGTDYSIAVDGFGSSTGNIQLKIVPVIINGTPSPDNLTGTAYSESINGLAGNDTINGAAGNDTLNGNEGADQLIGGLGNDIYIVDNTGDVVTELPNDPGDVVQSSVTYTLPAEVEGLVLTGSAEVNATGNNLNNNIHGNSSNNILIGFSGNDTLSGLDGNDALLGGIGNDILTGGTGSDQFVFESSFPAAGVDTITDFDLFSDKVLLDKTVFSSLETVAGSPAMGGNPLQAGDFSIINVAAASEVAIAETSLNEIVYNIVTGSLFYNPNNNMPDFGAGGGQFATIVGSPDYFSSADFRVIFQSQSSEIETGLLSLRVNKAPSKKSF